MKMRMVLAVAVALMVACSWLVPLESVANQQVDAGLKRALISFATARALNAVISVVQGTEVAVQPAGVGINFAPGQILDPVNDLVEQFGQLMLVASVAFGVEKVLISMGAHWAISSLLTVTAIAWVYAYLRRGTSPPWLTRMLLILLMTRFAMPLAIIGSDQLFREFLAADYQSSQQVIEVASGQINKLNTTVAPVTEDQSMVEQDHRLGVQKCRHQTSSGKSQANRRTNDRAHHPAHGDFPAPDSGSASIAALGSVGNRQRNF